MGTRARAGLAAMLVVLAGCGTSAGAGSADTTSPAAAPGPGGNVESTDPAWDDAGRIAELVERCVATRTRQAAYAGIPEPQLAAGCLDDARVLEASGCSLVAAIRALTVLDPDASQGQCPA